MDSGDRGQVDDIDIDEGRGCASQNVEVLFWSGRTGCLFYIFSGAAWPWACTVAGSIPAYAAPYFYFLLEKLNVWFCFWFCATKVGLARYALPVRDGRRPRRRGRSIWAAAETPTRA